MFLVSDPNLEDIYCDVVDMFWVMERRDVVYFGLKRKDRYTDWNKLAYKGNKLS